MSEPIIYGKNNMERIVSMEVTDGSAELFIQNPDGSIISKVVPNKFWILAPERYDRSFVRLKGDLHYKWGRQFDTRNDYEKMRKIYRGMKRELFTVYNERESLMIKDGYTFFKGMKYREPSMLAFDIETNGLAINDRSEIYLISNIYRINDKIEHKLFVYSDYESQGDMIEAWAKWVKAKDPTFLVGHNINSYDIPFIANLADIFGITLDLGRDGSPLRIDRTESKFRVDGNRDLHYKRIKVYGREIIDTMFLAYRYDIDRKYEDYGLKTIIKQEGLEVKDRVFYDASKIKDNYKDPKEMEKIKAYCMFDADDVISLYDKMAPSFFYMAQAIPKPFQMVIESASGSQINAMMNRSYLQFAHSLPKASDRVEFEGAISFGVPGVWKNVVKWDVASLYPSIMEAYEVYDQDKDPAANFLMLVKTFRAMRLEFKKKAKETKDEYFEAMQNTYKILINSMYGMMGASGLNFNSPINAALVTRKGREVLKLAIEWATGMQYDEWRKQYLGEEEPDEIPVLSE